MNKIIKFDIMKKYLVVIEKAEHNYSAFSPDAPGCITVGDTIEETILHMKEALELYFEFDIDNGVPIPDPKGLKYHIKAGIFDENEIAEEYYITEVGVKLPQLTHA